MAEGYRTRRELVVEALTALEQVGAGQAPAPEDIKLVDGKLEPVLARMVAREIIDAIDPDQVPDELFLPLAVMLGDSAALDFGVSRGMTNDPNSWAAKVAQAEFDIRDMRASRPGYGTAQPEYF